MPLPTFTNLHIDDLDIQDEASFRHVALYADLKALLREANYTFQVLPDQARGRWDQAQFLNLTFWGAAEEGDLLVDPAPPADQIAHVAWHYLAQKALGEGSDSAPSAAALFLGESIASAFDVYLVGRLLGHAPVSSFLETQVAAMADAADAAGASAEEFETLLHGIAEDPELAFAELRKLLNSATNALFACATAEAAFEALVAFQSHRFAPLLHHYELSNWVLYARAYARPCEAMDAKVATAEAALGAKRESLDWLAENWLTD